jgi:protein-tyrosine phosphatase
MSERERIGVLFVCHANICRSPLAEAVFRRLVAERGAEDRFEIDSAGTWAPDGALPHEHSVDVGREHGIPVAYFDRVSRAITPDDMDRFDHVLVMDRRNLADIERLRRLSAPEGRGDLSAPKGRGDNSGFGDVERGWPDVRLLRMVLDPAAKGGDAEVPDPIGRGREHYQRTFELVEAACRRLLDELLDQSG